MGVSKVPGSFGDFEGEFAFDAEAPEKGWSRAVIRVASMDTGSEKRDDHLRYPPWIPCPGFGPGFFLAIGLPACSMPP